MNFLKLGILLPLVPLFIAPLLLVAGSWIERRRHASRRSSPSRRQARL